MTRRPGMSLTEVLVALFIMALGTIAILTMFPLGAIQMGQALKDDRTAQCSNQADAYMRWYWKTKVVESGPDAFTTAFTNPGNGATALTTAANAGQPSYPVAIDPMGFAAGSTGPVAGVSSLPRQNLALIASSATPDLFALRTCSLLDGFGFAPASYGVPTDPSTNQVDRDYRYNWMWVLQQPNISFPNNATMTVVVFNQRAYKYNPPNAEASTTVGFTPGSTSLQSVSVPAGVVVQKGSWVLDATSSGTIRQAYFYQVVSVTPGASGVDIELQTPIRRIDGNTNAYNGTLVFLAGVADVFERPILTNSQF